MVLMPSGLKKIIVASAIVAFFGYNGVKVVFNVMAAVRSVEDQIVRTARAARMIT